MIPIAVDQLNETNSALGEPPSQKAIVGVGSFARFGAVLVEDVLGLFGDVHQLRHAGLHAVGHLVIVDLRGDFRFAKLSQSETIQLLDTVKELATGFHADPFRIGDIENRIAAAAEGNTLIIAGQKTVSPVAGL